MENNVLPWERPRIKRILEILGGRVYTVKHRTMEVNKDEIER